MSFDEGRILLFQRDKVEFDALMNEEKSLREAGIRLLESFHQEKLTELRKKLEEESAGIYSRSLQNEFDVYIAVRYADSNEVYRDKLFDKNVRIPDVEFRSYTVDEATKEMHLLIGCCKEDGNKDFTADKDINIDLGKRSFQAGEVRIYFHYIDELRMIVEVFGGEEYLFSEEVRLCTGEAEGRTLANRNMTPDIEDVDLVSGGRSGMAKSMECVPVGALKRDGTLDISRLVDSKLYLLAINFIKNRKYKNAEDCLKDLSRKGNRKAEKLLQYLYDRDFNDDIPALLNLAESCIEKNDPESLKEAEEIAVRLHESGHPLADYILGECHISKNSYIYDTEEALSCFRRFIASDTVEENDERRIIAEHYCALIIFNDRNATLPMLEDALRYAREVSDRNPSDANVSALIEKIEERIGMPGGRNKKKIKYLAIALVILGVIVFLLIRVTGSAGSAGDSVNGISSESSKSEKRFSVSVDAANIRSGPGTDHEVVSSGENGETFLATGKEENASDGTWYEIYLSDDRSKTGWVSAKVVTET
ncbi:MAG: SH3 domain-containing protein [Oribacterium sp.]|nr:SH3 domain-containing protein [Oribacterium sp.]